MHFKEYERKGMGTGAGEGVREAHKEEPTDSERGFSNIIRPQLPSIHGFIALARSFVRPFLLDRTHAHTRHAHRRHEYLSR